MAFHLIFVPVKNNYKSKNRPLNGFDIQYSFEQTCSTFIFKPSCDTRHLSIHFPHCHVFWRVYWLVGWLVDQPT